MAATKFARTRRDSARAPVSASPLTVTRTRDALALEVHPSPELPRALELKVNLRPYGATMSATLWTGNGERAVMLSSTGYARLDPREGWAHWRLRMGLLAALVLGDVSLPLTQAQARELRAVLGPLGLEVIGAPPALEGVRS